MNSFFPLALSLGAGLTAYAAYWAVTRRCNQVRSHWPSISTAEMRLRRGWAGFARMWLCWALVLTIQALCMAPEGTMFSQAWWSAALPWDQAAWIGILGAALARAEGWAVLGRRRSPAAEAESEPVHAAPATAA